jgi:peroxiredoxin Q/BCP
VGIGDVAPSFVAIDHQGHRLRLDDLILEGSVVIYFYPKDDTPACTTEACAFRDAYAEFVDAGARVVGVSSDSAECHQAFAARHHLPYSLIPDPQGVLRHTFGVPRTLGLLPGRVTYVIDRKGIVRHVFSSQFRAERHIEEALRTVRHLQDPP